MRVDVTLEEVLKALQIAKVVAIDNNHPDHMTTYNFKKATVEKNSDGVEYILLGKPKIK